MIGYFSCLCHLLIFFSSKIKKSLWQEYHQIHRQYQNSLGPDEAQHFVGHDLGSICFQRLSADNTKLKVAIVFWKSEL